MQDNNHLIYYYDLNLPNENNHLLSKAIKHAMNQDAKFVNILSLKKTCIPPGTKVKIHSLTLLVIALTQCTLFSAINITEVTTLVRLTQSFS